MKIYNSLSRTKEEFVPIDNKKVRMYTCGPTVYNYVTIGNWRTYILGDLVARVLKYQGYDIEYVMNITDVGHLTGDNEGDASIGEDRLDKASKIEGKSAWEIADYYTKDFLYWYEKLNLFKPKVWCKATDHISEQIEMIKKIENKGYVYIIDLDGVYFDVGKFENDGYKYGELSTLDEIKEGARLEINPNKRDPRDFALWKFSYPSDKRHMEWDSPWGRGYPGWHIECSAMAVKYLGEQFDIHLGGEDLRSTHHPNEIIQSEVATGCTPFVTYWMHGAFLLVDGGRMGKSLGNAYTVKDIMERGFDPLALRYFYMTGHYRKQLNFTWDGLESAAKALDGLFQHAEVFGDREVSLDGLMITNNMKDIIIKFNEALDDDFNFPMALGIIHDGISQANNDNDLMYLLMTVDQVLGLDLMIVGKQRYQEWNELTTKFRDLLGKRDEHRKNRNWVEADKIRLDIEQQGLIIEDRESGAVIRSRK